MLFTIIVTNEATSPEEFKILQHWKRIKERVRDEVHTAPSEILSQERLVLQKEPHNVSILALGLYMKEYAQYKSGFDAIRKQNKPKIPMDMDDIDFESEEYKQFTETIDKKAFLQYDNKSKKGNRIQISVGIQVHVLVSTY